MLAERRRSRKIKVGWVEVGGDAPIRVQSMTTTKTADVNATLQQMASLVATGCEIVRVAVPHWEDARALKQIAEHATIPVVADIHFQWKYAMAALEAGVHGLRINPGNIKYQDKVRLIADRGARHDSGRRRHPLSVEVRDGRARGRRPWAADQPRQHQVPRQGQAHRRSRSTPRFRSSPTSTFSGSTRWPRSRPASMGCGSTPATSSTKTRSGSS